MISTPCLLRQALRRAGGARLSRGQGRGDRGHLAGDTGQRTPCGGRCTGETRQGNSVSLSQPLWGSGVSAQGHATALLVPARAGGQQRCWGSPRAPWAAQLCSRLRTDLSHFKQGQELLRIRISSTASVESTVWECPHTPAGAGAGRARGVYQSPCPWHPQASIVPRAPCMARHPKVGAPRCFSWAAEVGSPGPPGCSVQGNTPEGAPATSWEEQGDSHCLGLPRDGAVPVVRAAWDVELSSVVSTGTTQPNLPAFPSPRDPQSSPDGALSPVGWPGTGSRQEVLEAVDVCLQHPQLQRHEQQPGEANGA